MASTLDPVDTAAAAQFAGPPHPDAQHNAQVGSPDELPQSPDFGSPSTFGSPELDAAFAVGISWKDITFAVGEKKILQGLTGTARPGRLLAIMGKSGAGKTTLLKLIADRLHRDGDRTVEGTMYVNEVEFTAKHRSLISFVPQDDILNGLASAEETLHFAARMRRGYLSVEETDKMVEKSLQELGLVHVKDVVIGIPGITTGLSGGERKRVNIGAEFVHRPKVLLLDEPTTGLDSVTSERIVKLLRNLARRGHTIICTIHQPTYDCMNLFDDLLLLAAGRPVYHGPMEDAVAYFASAGFTCPTDATPTDYFMWHVEDEKDCPKLLQAWEDHVSGIASSSSTSSSAANNKNTADNNGQLPECLVAPYTGGPSQADTLGYLNKNFGESEVPWFTQVVELFKRAFLNAMRNQMNVIATLMQAVVFGIFVGVLFNNIEDNSQGVADRFGVLFTMAVNTAFAGSSAVINTFPAIKAVFLREQQAGAYSVGAFFIATFLADMPLQVLSMLIQVIIVYWSADLEASAARFFTFFAVMVVTQQVSVSVGLALSAATSNAVIAAALVPALMTPMMLTGGFLASTDRLRPYWVWLERVSFIRMPFVLMAHNEFEGHDTQYGCDVAKFGARFCAAQPRNGTAVLRAQELDTDLDADWVSWMSLFLILITLRLLGYLALWRSAGQKE